MGGFFCLLEDNNIRKILLNQNIEPQIGGIFIDRGTQLLANNPDEVEFDGNYNVADNEILFVQISLSDAFSEIANNTIEIPELDLKTDSIKALFWYDEGVYYFQNFDNRKLLSNRNILLYSKNTYDKLSSDAFIVDNTVNAVYKEGRFYFKSYFNANKIFSLIDFYHEATNEEIDGFCANNHISADGNWLKENSTTPIRKQITLIQKSGILANVSPKKISSSAKKFNLKIDVDVAGKIVLPNDKKGCKAVLSFLNEQYYVGLISGNKYQTNSKKKVEIVNVN